jgi:hypothetical protein
MKLRVLTLAGLLALSSPAVGQDPGQLPMARFTITPFVGVRVPFTSSRQAEVIVAGEDEPFVFGFDEERGGGATAGIETALRLAGPFSLAGSFMYAGSDDILLVTQVEDALTQLEVDGPSVWFAKVGVSYRLPDPNPDTRRFHPAGYLTAGPALVRENYGDSPLGFEEESVNSWAINVGARAVQALGSRNAAFFLGFDDYVTFWNTDDFERQRIERFLRLQPGTILNADFDYDRSHILMLQAGVSLRF